MRQSLQIALLWSLLCLPLVASLGPQLSAVPAVTFSGGNSQDLLVVGDAAYVADGSNGIRYFPNFPASSSHDLIRSGQWVEM
jgi:hypothetical protein